MAMASLRSVKSEREVIRLRRDHYSVSNWSIMTDGYRVWISKQKLGEAATHNIEIPKRAFDRLIAMYERPQKQVRK